MCCGLPQYASVQDLEDALLMPKREQSFQFVLPYTPRLSRSPAINEAFPRNTSDRWCAFIMDLSQENGADRNSVEQTSYPRS